MEAPRCRKSTTESDEPRRDIPSKENVDARRAKPRSEIDEPRCKKSITEIDEPRRM
jgi:hypothetical protein